jgi:hypothetical protein
MSQNAVVLFHTTSSAMRAEKTLIGAGLTVKMIPTPRQFSSDCGIALRFDRLLIETVRTLLDDARVETAGMHPLD